MLISGEIIIVDSKRIFHSQEKRSRYVEIHAGTGEYKIIVKIFKLKNLQAPYKTLSLKSDTTFQKINDDSFGIKFGDVIFYFGDSITRDQWFHIVEANHNVEAPQSRSPEIPFVIQSTNSVTARSKSPLDARDGSDVSRGAVGLGSGQSESTLTSEFGGPLRPRKSMRARNNNDITGGSKKNSPVSSAFFQDRTVDFQRLNMNSEFDALSDTKRSKSPFHPRNISRSESEILFDGASQFSSPAQTDYSKSPMTDLSRFTPSVGGNSPSLGLTGSKIIEFQSNCEQKDNSGAHNASLEETPKEESTEFVEMKIELDAMRELNNQLNESLETMQSNFRNSFDDLNSKLFSSDNDNASLKLALEKMNMAHEELTTSHTNLKQEHEHLVSISSELECELQKTKEHSLQLEEKVKNYQALEDDLNENMKINQLQRRIESLLSQSEVSDLEISNLNEKIFQLNADIVGLSDILQLKDDTIQGMEYQMKDLKNQVMGLKNEKSSMETKAERLKSKLTLEFSHELEKAQHRIEGLEKQVMEQDNEMKRAGSIQSELKTQIQNLESVTQNQRDMIALLNKELEGSKEMKDKNQSLKTTMASLQSQLFETQSKAQRLQQEKDDCGRDFEGQRVELLETMSHLKLRIEELTSSKDTFEKKSRQYFQESENLASEIVVLNHRIESHAEKCRQLEEELTNEQQRRSADRKIHQSYKIESEEAIAKSRSRIKEVENRCFLIEENSIMEVKSLRMKILELEGEISQLQESLKETKRVGSEIRDEKDRYHDLWLAEKQVHNLLKEQYEDSKASFTHENRLLQQELSDKQAIHQATLVTLDHANSDLKNELMSLKESFQNQITENSELQKRLQLFHLDHSRLEQELEDAKAQMDLKRSFDELQATLERNRQELQVVSQTKEDIQSQLAHSKDIVHDLEQRYKFLEETNKNLLQENKLLIPIAQKMEMIRNSLESMEHTNENNGSLKLDFRSLRQWTNQQLHEMNRDLLKFYHTIRVSLEQFQHFNESMNSQNSELRKSLKSQEATCKIQQRDIDTMQTTITFLEERNRSLQLQIEQITNHEVELETGMKTLKAEKEDMIQTHLMQKISSEGSITMLKTNIQDLKAMIAETQEKNNSLAMELSTSKQNWHRLNAEKNQLSNQLFEKNMRIADLEKEVQSVHEEMKSTQHLYEEYYKKSEELSSSLQKSKNDFQSNDSKLQLQLESSKRKIRDLESDFHLKSQGFESRIEDIVNQLKSENRRNEVLQQENSDLSNQMLLLQQTNREKAEIIESLKSDIAKEKVITKRLRDDVGECRTKLTDQDRHIHEKISQISSLESSVQSLLEENKQLQVLGTKLRGQLNQSMDAVKDIKIKSKDMEYQIEELQAKIEEQEKLFESSESSNHNLNAKLEQMMSTRSIEKEDYNKKMDELKNHNDSLRNQYEILQNNFATMESTLNLTQEELKRKIFDIQKCKEEKKSLSDQLQMSFDKLSRMIDREVHEREINDYQKQLSCITQEKNDREIAINSQLKCLYDKYLLSWKYIMDISEILSGDSSTRVASPKNFDANEVVLSSSISNSSSPITIIEEMINVLTQSSDIEILSSLKIHVQTLYLNLQLCHNLLASDSSSTSSTKSSEALIDLVKNVKREIEANKSKQEEEKNKMELKLFETNVENKELFHKNKSLEMSMQMMHSKLELLEADSRKSSMELESLRQEMRTKQSELEEKHRSNLDYAQNCFKTSLEEQRHTSKSQIEELQIKLREQMESMSQTKALLEQELVSRKEEHDREILELKKSQENQLQQALTTFHDKERKYLEVMEEMKIKNQKALENQASTYETELQNLELSISDLERALDEKTQELQLIAESKDKMEFKMIKESQLRRDLEKKLRILGTSSEEDHSSRVFHRNHPTTVELSSLRFGNQDEKSNQRDYEIEDNNINDNANDMDKSGNSRIIKSSRFIEEQIRKRGWKPEKI